MSTVNPQHPAPVYTTAITAQPPAVAVTPAEPAVAGHEAAHEEIRPLRIYSHSAFFYWWPVWAIGYLMAILTYMNHVAVPIGSNEEWFYPSKNPGVIYSVVFFLVILFSNATARGLASVVTVLAILFLTVLFAYLGWWETILSWLPHLSVHMNMGFYMFFSTLMFVTWMLATFVFDHMSYWTIRPGQITQEFVVGGAEKSYDTRGMVFEKLRQDLFKQWILGFGSGDIIISTMGAKREQLHVPNVLFVDRRVRQIQQLIAMHRDQFAAPVT